MAEFFDIVIFKPLGWVLKLCSKATGNNYLLAILLFAVIFEVILLPFAIKQQKNSIKQARLRPKEMAIRKKYAGRNDKPTQQKMAQEIQELYQKEGYNPMSGCLPLLIQLPLLMALYNIVINPLKYICGFSNEAISQIATITGVNASTSQTMSLLAPMREMGAAAFKTVDGFSEGVFNSLPNLKAFSIDLALKPSECIGQLNNLTAWLVLMIPVITFFAYFFSMKITRKFTYQPMADNQQAQMGCSNKIMDITMPLFSVWIAAINPAALGVYWIFKSLIGVLKQIIISKVMPLPKFTEEDYKAAEKEIGARADKNTKVAKSGRVVRSLHHIDDEDFEDTAEAARRHKEALEAQEAADKAASKKKNNLLATAPIKSEKTEEKNKEASEEKAENVNDGSEEKTDGEI